jgi:HK97 family phage prohead protease
VTATLPAPSAGGVLFRSLGEADVEIRTVAGKRELRGIIVPFNTAQRIDSRLTERFLPGVFRKQLAAPHRIPLFRDHEMHGGTLIGKALELREDAAGQYGAFRVAPTLAGDEALALVEDGALNQWSIGFREGQNRRAPDGTVERVSAILTETAIVLRGAYGDEAAIHEVREEQEHACTCGAPLATVRADEVRTLLAQLPSLPLPPM